MTRRVAHVGRCTIIMLCVLSPACRHSDRDSIQESAKSSTSNNDDLLSPKERQRIWDIEHHAFVLEQKVFPVVKRAISNAKLEPLASYLSSSFTAAPIAQWSELSSKGFYRQFVQSPSERDPSVPELDRAAFLNEILSYRAYFDSPPSNCKASIGIVRLGADDSGHWNSIWKLRLAGKRGQQRVELTIRLGLSLDRLNDQLADQTGWITSAKVLSATRTESSQMLMEEVTDSTGLVIDGLYDNWQETKFRSNTGGIYLSDYNNDGHLDLLVDDIRAGVRLYRGRPDARFEDVTVKAGLAVTDPSPVWALSCWGDFDSDGDEDLITEDRIYRNQGDGTFVDITDKSNLLLTPAQGYCVADYDLDGILDIYVCHSAAYRIGQEKDTTSPWIDGGTGIDNILWRGRGDWQFEDVTAETQTGAGGSSCFSGVFLDANDDHRPDLLAINEFGRNSLFMFDEDSVAREVHLDPVFGGFSMGAASGDMDNDGRTDLYVANMYSKAGNRILSNVDSRSYPSELLAKLREGTMGSKLYYSGGDGTFEAASPTSTVADVGWAYGSSTVDFDGDGFLDIYATAGFKSHQRGKPDG